MNITKSSRKIIYCVISRRFKENVSEIKNQINSEFSL